MHNRISSFSYTYNPKIFLQSNRDIQTNYAFNRGSIWLDYANLFISRASPVWIDPRILIQYSIQSIVLMCIAIQTSNWKADLLGSPEGQIWECDKNVTRKTKPEPIQGGQSSNSEKNILNQSS